MKSKECRIRYLGIRASHEYTYAPPTNRKSIFEPFAFEEALKMNFSRVLPAPLATTSVVNKARKEE
jgi:hypothetical protein